MPMPSVSSLRKRAASMPIAPRALPLMSNATPVAAPISLNVPSPWLWNKKFCTVSLATTRSMPAVVVEVGEGDAERLGRRHTRVGVAHLHAGLGDVGELAVAVVVVEIGQGPLEVLRPAVRAAAAGELEVLAFVELARPADVVADEQVEVAVVVVVEPAAAGAPVCSHRRRRRPSR